MGFSAEGCRPGWLSHTSHLAENLARRQNTLSEFHGCGDIYAMPPFSFPFRNACELPKTHFTQKWVLLLVLKCLTLHWLSFGVTPHLPSPRQNTEFCVWDQRQYKQSQYLGCFPDWLQKLTISFQVEIVFL